MDTRSQSIIGRLVSKFYVSPFLSRYLRGRLWRRSFSGWLRHQSLISLVETDRESRVLKMRAGSKEFVGFDISLSCDWSRPIEGHALWKASGPQGNWPTRLPPPRGRPTNENGKYKTKKSLVSFLVVGFCCLFTFWCVGHNRGMAAPFLLLHFLWRSSLKKLCTCLPYYVTSPKTTFLGKKVCLNPSRTALPFLGQSTWN